MARVKLGEILDEHRSEMRLAIKAVIGEYAPELAEEAGTISRKIIRRFNARVGTWTRVKDSHVDAD